MPKASLAAKDTYELKGGFQEGWGEITGAVSRIVQFNPSKKTGEQLPPFLALVLQIQRTDEHGKASSDEPTEVELKLHGDLSQMRPGSIKSRDDDDPVDVDENATVGAEGNCIYVAEEGIKLNKNGKALRFLRSLEEHGFKPDILGAGYFPDLIGLRAHFKQEIGQKFREDTADPTFLVVDKIAQFGYEKKAGAAKAKPAAAAAGKPAPAAKVNGAPTPAADGDDAKAKEILALVASEHPGETVAIAKLNVMAFQKVAKSVEAAGRKKVIDQIKNLDWLSEAGLEVGIAVEGDSVTFA